MVSLADVEAARERLRGVIVATPILPGARLSEDAGGNVFVKAENTQRGGSFKLRGAYNKISDLSLEQRQRGVIAASMGNHAQGVALAARMLGAPAVVVMPEEASLTKVTATRRYGAQVILHGQSFDEATAHALSLSASEGYTLVHAFDDPAIVAGQGVVGLEILDALPEVGTVIVAIGGGGLIGGIATAIRARKPSVRMIGVQAAGCSSVRASMAAGMPVMLAEARTIADGIAVKRPGDVTLPIIQALVEEVVTVEEDEIADAIFYTLQHLRLLVEGAGAVGVAALLTGKVRPRGDEQVCVVLSGGNIDANLLARVIDQSLARSGRYVVLRTSVPDRPGNLAQLALIVAEAGANVVDIHHRRSLWGVPLADTGLELVLEVRDEQHAQEVVTSLTTAGYGISRVGGREYVD
ncbi:MAG TPA: threonine ammonia-lyase [Thermomicrobiales bacterium]|nr:threonine ammonia-lyase [Thermomicrobiales bacterium]